MTIGAAIREYLSRQEPVSSLVGTRIFGDQAEQGASSPYIVYTMPASNEPGHLTGTSGLARATVQINCWSRKKPESERIRDEVRNVLQTFQGKVVGKDGSVSIRSCRIGNAADGFVPDQEGSATGDFSAGLSLNVWYRVKQPAAV